MKKLMSYLMLSCKRATELIEKKLLVGLSFRERAQLSFHNSMCEACTVYEKQSGKIDKLLQEHFQDANKDKPILINDALKEKINNSIF